MEENATSKNLGFEYSEDISYSYHKIKKEYRKKAIRIVSILSVLLIIVVIHFTLIYPIYLIPDEGAVITGLTPYRFNLTINWIIFSIGTYTIFYLIKIILMRVTPSLKKDIENDVNALGFNIKRTRKSWILFLLLNSISVISLFLIELDIIYFNIPILNELFKGLFIFYLFICLLIPVLWRFSYDGLNITLKDKYSVSINPYYKIRKIKDQDSQLIGIFMTSNKITNKFEKNKKRLYTQIAESRWLPRKKKSIVSKYGLSPFLRFHEFSTPINFVNQLLNIVLALQDWDMQSKNANQIERDFI
ncbi:MAG: hypothetical protein ACFE9C_07925 [Candidatus Hodarchaeota archaeon]